MDFDSSWCPVCDRQILPKRFQVPVAPPLPPPTAAPPSSPLPSPTKTTANIRRTKGGTIRARPNGLVQGTGRVKPNGTIKRVDSSTKVQSPPPAPVKLRTVIDQGPIPLYCSDECQLADINNADACIPINYNPERQSLAPPALHKSYSSNGSETESDSSVDSHSSRSSTSSTTRMSPSMATLAALYNFPPMPPPAPVFSDDSTSEADYPHEYSSGIMMAARRIEAFCPKPAKRSSIGQYSNPSEPRKPIPGWTDGSNAWRSSIYSFSSPKDAPNADDSPKAYKSFSASSHRSNGVYSTLGESSASSRHAVSSNSVPSATNEMITKFSESFVRRSESRSSMFASSSPTSPHSLPTTSPTSQRRERSLLKPGAEGKLLVPNVKMRVSGGSSTSLSSAWSATSSRRSVRSPLSYGSDVSDEDVLTQRCDSSASLPTTTKRPTVETRSWSYDNLKTYPVMQRPLKKEKRWETRIVNGVEIDVEIEVVVEEPMKRLFNFPGPWVEGQQQSSRRSD